MYSISNNTITSLTSDDEINMISSYEKENGVNIAEENKVSSRYRVGNRRFAVGILLLTSAQRGGFDKVPLGIMQNNKVLPRIAKFRM